MQINCPYAFEVCGIGSCYTCPVKGRCTAYALIMDLTAIRNKCPLDDQKEYCTKIVKEFKDDTKRLISLFNEFVTKWLRIEGVDTD